MNVAVPQDLTKPTDILFSTCAEAHIEFLNSFGFPDGQVFVYFEVSAASNTCRTFMRTTFNITEVPVCRRVTRNVSCFEGWFIGTK
jgi:hypothetical protein